MTSDIDSVGNESRRRFLQKAALTVIGAGIAATGLCRCQTEAAADGLDSDGSQPGPPKSPKVKIGKLSEFKPGSKKSFAGSGFEVERRGDKICAISLHCTHRGVLIDPSAKGFVCPAHGAQYDQDGRVTHGPAQKNLPWYSVTLLKGGELEVDTSKIVPLGTFFDVKKKK